MNNFSPHISFTELADIADQQSQASGESLEHLASCSDCASQLRTIRQTVGLMRSDRAEDAPAASIKHAKDLFRSRTASEESSLLARVMAALTFDSLTSAPAFGLRSQTISGRQLVYSTETADIDVRVSPEKDEWQIAGQILGSDCENGNVNLQGDSFSVSAELNELCEFSFGSVPNGIYKISVHLPGLIIETPPLELRT